MKGVIILLAVFASVLTGAADLTTKTSKIYKDYEIDKATPHGLTIFHESGTATIPYAELPDDLQSKYNKHVEQAKNTQEILELLGYKLGDAFDTKMSLKTFPENRFLAKVKMPLFGQKTCNIGVTSTGEIYEIVLLFSNATQANINTAIKYLKDTFPDISIGKDKYSNLEAERRHQSRVMKFSSLTPLQGDFPGYFQIKITDESLEPNEQKLFKHIEKKYDEMQKVTWFKPLWEIEYKHENATFLIEPYVGKFDNGEVILRVKASYAMEDLNDALWIFYTRIQFMSDSGADVNIVIPQESRESEVLKHGIVEWSDSVVGNGFLGLKDAKTIKVRFYGKYSNEFSLTKEQCQSVNDIIVLYNYLKSSPKK